MKQLKCEMCGSTNLLKQDSVFVCQNCGNKYSVEEAKKIMVEIDSSVEIENELVLARKAYEGNNFSKCIKCAEKVIKFSPLCSEAYVLKSKALMGLYENMYDSLAWDFGDEKDSEKRDKAEQICKETSVWIKHIMDNDIINHQGKKEVAKEIYHLANSADDWGLWQKSIKYIYQTDDELAVALAECAYGIDKIIRLLEFKKWNLSDEGLGRFYGKLVKNILEIKLEDIAQEDRKNYDEIITKKEWYYEVGKESNDLLKDLISDLKDINPDFDIQSIEIEAIERDLYGYVVLQEWFISDYEKSGKFDGDLDFVEFFNYNANYIKKLDESFDVDVEIANRLDEINLFLKNYTLKRERENKKLQTIKKINIDKESADQIKGIIEKMRNHKKWAEEERSNVWVNYFNEEKAKLSKIYNTNLEISEDLKREAEELLNTDINQFTKKGCYVATCVYGSYDCPEVWTLRRFRDYSLDETWYGRAFIRTYYAISPTIVKWFGETEWFKKLWKGKLDKFVRKLNKKGYENTKYNDRY